jgi:hypothetical protein
MAYKTSSMIKNHKKLKVRKYNPTKDKYEFYVESKLPSHTK